MSASHSEHRRTGAARRGNVDISLPADAALIPAARAAVAGILRRMGFGSTVIAALRRATDALASSLVERALPWARLDIELTHDEEDLYLRMAVDRAVAAEPCSAGVTRLVLSGDIDSADVGGEDGSVYGVVQRALV